MIEDFKGKTAVLTGAASGFGLECARIGAVGQLGPFQRCRNRSTGFRADAIRTGDGLPLNILQVIDVNRCGTARFDEPLDCGLPWICFRYFGGDHLCHEGSSLVRGSRWKR